ncbi:MAG: SRPBCC family protein, partial [Woeseiaceae bacterium]
MLVVRQNLLRGLLLTALCISPVNVAGAELRSVSVVLEEGRYCLTSETVFAASQEDLYAVLTDYELFEKFTSAIVASRNLEPDADGRPRFYTRMEGCILFYCKNFVRNGYLLLTPKHDIVAITDPDESDFEYSRERWRLSSDGEGTLLIYEFELEPTFWVPPLV